MVALINGIFRHYCYGSYTVISFAATFFNPNPMQFFFPTVSNPAPTIQFRILPRYHQQPIQSKIPNYKQKQKLTLHNPLHRFSPTLRNQPHKSQCNIPYFIIFMQQMDMSLHRIHSFSFWVLELFYCGIMSCFKLFYVSS